MNKKAAILHWILFGILGAFAWFFVLSAQIDIGSAKGDWQLTFLQQNYFPAEQELLQLQSLAKAVAFDTLEDLHNRGGFPAQSTTACGNLGELPLWNKAEMECFPDAEQNFLTEVQQRLIQRTQQQEMLIMLQGTMLSGRSDTRTIISPAGSYTFERNFIVNLGYSLSEYQHIQREAQTLLAACRNQKDLTACLDSSKGSWQTGTCGQSVPISTTRQISFCVLSPSGATLRGKLVQYQATLDFTPTKPFSVENVQLRTTADWIELSIPLQEEAEKYNIYITDYQGVEQKTGSASEIAKDIPLGLGFFWEVAGEFTSPQLIRNAAPCQEESVKAFKMPYLCGDSILYRLDRREYPTPNLFFVLAVTVQVQGEESEITTWLTTNS